MHRRLNVCNQEVAVRVSDRRPWARRLRQRLSASEVNGQLVLRRRWQPHALALGIYGLLVAAGLFVSWETSAWQQFLHHSPDFRFCLGLLDAVLVAGPLLYARRFWMRRRVFIFDRQHDYVTCDGKVMCALSEVESVRVGKPLAGEGGPKELGFLIHGRNEVGIEWGDLVGASLEEMGQAGQALSQYAGVPLWSEGEWRNPNAPDDLPPPVATADPTRQIQIKRIASPCVPCASV